MAPPEPVSTITLRVKVPPGYINSSADEFTLGSDIPITATIGHVREQIRDTLPSHPAPDRQRLLYSGRALIDNDQTLADALTVRRDPSQKEYVLHLVVRGVENANPALPPMTASADRTPVGQRTGLNPNATGAAQQHQQQQHHHHHHQFQQVHVPLHAPGVVRTHVGPTGTPPPPPTGSPQLAGPNQGGANLPRDAQHPHAHPIPNQGFRVEGFGQNGQHFAIHHQTVHFPAPRVPFGMPPGMPSGLPPGLVHGMPPGLPPGLHPAFAHGFPAGLPPQGPPTTPAAPSASAPADSARPSALDRARENIVEMRRIIEELQTETAISEESQARIRRLEEQTRSLSDYIDPLRLGPSLNPTRSPTEALREMARESSSRGHPSPGMGGPLPSMANLGGSMFGAVSLAPPPRTSPNARNAPGGDVSCFLLSSPDGPQALLFAPGHGHFHGSMPVVRPSASQTFPAPTLTTTAPIQAPDVQPLPLQPIAQIPDGGAGGVPAQAAAPPNALAPHQQVLGHLWLLFRILICAYFLLGAEMGWRRHVLLFGIMFGFWLIRLGVWGDGGPVRRWWEGIMLGGPRQANPDVVPAANNPARDAPGAPAQARMPTPQEVARRILRENRERRHAGRMMRMRFWREQMRPLERAAALFIGSLWPGVGEAAVRARETRDAEVRRRVEEAEAARRGEEQARIEQRQQQGQGQQEKEGESADSPLLGKSEGDERGVQVEAGSSREGNGEKTASQLAADW